MPLPRLFPSWMSLLLGLILTGPVSGQFSTQTHDRVLVVPAPGKVTVDGDLGDWDLSAALSCVYDEALKPRFTMQLAVMYDREALYLAARFHDETPLRNVHDPDTEPNLGWAGDALQVRLVSDPKAPYPHSSTRRDPNPHICHLTMWYHTPTKRPVLQRSFGMDHHGSRIWTGAESGLAFRAHPDGQGYTLEARIPHDRLGFKEPPRAEDRIAFTVQPLWGDSDGRKQVMSFFDVVRGQGFSYQGTATWGQAVFLREGNLKPTATPQTGGGSATPLVLRLPVADPEATLVSANLWNEAGQMVRSLPVQTRATADPATPWELRWDGLDDDGRPLPPGRYTVKTLSHRGIGLKYLLSLHNSGNPPWRTDDGLGGWGSDHAPPIAAASDQRHVYLAWELAESGSAIVAVDLQLTADGKPRKRWAANQVHDLGWTITALAADGPRLFVAQDGLTGATRNAPDAEVQAGVVLWDAASGKPINFPFGKRVLPVRTWKRGLSSPLLMPVHEQFSRGSFDILQGNRTGKAINLVGIAVRGERLYASLVLEDKVVAFNWRTGQPEREYAVPRPGGVQVDAAGRVIVASGTNLLRLDPATGAMTTLVRDLAGPWGIALDGQGRIYVSDCGRAMQVKVFDPDGRPIGAIGTPGGRPWVGDYDRNGLLMPAGLTVASDGKVWVAEHDITPKRISVWAPTGAPTTWSLHAELFGASSYGVKGMADPRQPTHINVADCLWEVDYETGQAKLLKTMVRPGLKGPQFMHPGLNAGWAIQTLYYNGRKYYARTGRGQIIIYIDQDGLPQPVTALGRSGTIRRFQSMVVAVVGERSKEDTRQLGADPVFMWVDRNGDHIVQKEECREYRSDHSWMANWTVWLDNELTIYTCSFNRLGHVFRIPVQEWLPNGAPVYPNPGEVAPWFEVQGKTLTYGVYPDGDGAYVLEQDGGQLNGHNANWMAVSRYRGDGRRRWAYRRTWLGFGLTAPLTRPGDVTGAMSFIGKIHPRPDAPALIGLNTYWGQYQLLSEDGHWVAALCQDTRYGPRSNHDTVWAENFSGYVYDNGDNGKSYLLGGANDLRVWEITGLETLRRGEGTVTLSPAEVAQATSALAARGGSAATRPPLVVHRADKPWSIDGQADEVRWADAARLDAGAGRAIAAALAYDEQFLYAAFRVRDDSPFRNAGSDAALLFKTGDACELFLGADPKAPSKRSRPDKGDVRLLFAMLGDKPVCVLYEPLSAAGQTAPRLFGSPTGAERFDRVEVVAGARLAVQRDETAYVLEAAIPWSALRLKPRSGLTLRGDLGVIFSNPGGNLNATRVNYFNKDTAITNDIPSEARLQPGNWGEVRFQ
ncbi:MAG: hypothetical protein NZ700_16910 [Gemmataceae bacterium]|nr:hypothetical protein [Gemmataceae bacterium]MDW8265383.1 FlgD immunoglobulin-like domain containing protein [Gemmataceae bacterium]